MAAPAIPFRPTAVAPDVVDLHLVPTPARVRRRRSAAAVIVFGAVAAMLLLAVVIAHVTITQRQFDLEQLEKRATEEAVEYDRLRLRVAELESPDRVVAEAQGRLGMVQPETVTYLSPATAVAGEQRAAAKREDGGSRIAAQTPGWQVVKQTLADR